MEGSRATPHKIKEYILKADEPFILRNLLTWNVLSWALEDWMKLLKDKQFDIRKGTTQCTKTPQWENRCETLSASLSDFMDVSNLQSSSTWLYFDYKHMEQHFKDNPDFLEVRKLWVLFPPSKMSAMKPTRVPYEESSVYSNVNFSCGRNILQDLGDARVVELRPGDVLIVPRHWWHYVENLTTAISINTWIPLEADHRSRLEESLVRFFVALVMKNSDVEGVTKFLNPNERDLVDDPVDLRQISWCLEHLPHSASGKHSSSHNHDTLPEAVFLPKLTPGQLQERLLAKCGCLPRNDCTYQPSPPLAMEHVINAFCHPEVISKVADVLISTRNASSDK